MWDEQQHICPRRSLILAGGGMRVAYQAGVLVALEESGMRFHHVDGTSGGIFNTAMLASGLEPKEIAQRWRSLQIKNFISGRKFKDYLRPFSMTGYADADNIRKKVFPHLGIDLHKIRNNPSINATFNVCNFSNKTVEAIRNQKVLEDHLIAGVSLPMMMPALRIGEDWYTDAVWIKDAHLMEAVRNGSEELWLVWAIGNAPTYYAGAFNQYVHMIEMSANGALWEEFQQIERINQMILQGVGDLSQKHPIRLMVIKSPDPLPLDPDLFFNKINTRELINMGYAHTKAYLNDRTPSPTPMDIQATKNKEPEKTLSFRAQFEGELLWRDMPCHLTYYTYFRFSQSPSQLRCYASVYLGHLDEEIILYETQVLASETVSGKKWTILSKLLIDQQEHHLSSEFCLNNALDFLLGLELKNCSIRISNKADTLLEGQLHQPIGERLKASYFSQVSANGKKEGLTKRFDMISKLLEHEV
jgi:predicted acylesterase/phospholipase RssA